MGQKTVVAANPAATGILKEGIDMFSFTQFTNKIKNAITKNRGDAIDAKCQQSV